MYFRRSMFASWRSRLVLLAALVLPVSSPGQSARNVLVLHEGNATHPANVITSGIFREAFGSGPGNQFFEEYIDEDRLGGNDETLVELLRNRYAARKMDLVISDGWPALNFFFQHGEELWPGIPKVFYFIDPRELPARLPPNMTGVVGTADFGAVLDLALQLRPNTQRVFYVGGANAWEQTWRSFAEQDFKRFASRVQITYLNDLPLPELLDRLGRLPDNSVVVYSELLRDASGHVYVPARACPLITSASNAPVFGPFDSYIGCGVVGGAIRDIKDLASQTARLGLRVLQQGTTSGLPIESSPIRLVVDWRQLQRWGISEKRLPSGTIVQFRTPTFWEQYKWYMLAGLAATVAQLALIVILVMEIRRRKTADLLVSNLNGRLINASEEERKRIARELHDDIGQRLSLVSIELDMLEHNAHNPTLHPSLNESLQRLNEIISDVHNLSHRLHSSKLQKLGLQAALKELCEQLGRQYDLEVQFTPANVPFPLPEDFGLCFYRVAQEALNNCVKHSGSARVEVRLGAADGILTMTIKDYGGGFDPSAAANGLGLATMRERLRLVGGELLVTSRPGGGAELTAQARVESSLQQMTAA